MSEYMMSTNGVRHEVVSDDGHRMVLRNPSGSTIAVTKSRHKFKPWSSLSDQNWREIAWAIYGFRIADHNNHPEIANALRAIGVHLSKGERVRIAVEGSAVH